MDIIIEVLTKKGTSGVVQFLRYGLVSGVALAVDVGLLHLLYDYVGLHYAVAASISFLTGMVVVYLGSIWWAFDVRRLEDARKEMAIFAVIGVAGLVLNAVLIAFFVELFNFPVLIAKACTVIFVFLFNFGMRKYMLFRKG